MSTSSCGFFFFFFFFFPFVFHFFPLFRMSRFKLIYFPCRGRQEPAQLLMEMGGFSYETSPVNLATWKEDKEKQFVGRSPFGQLPILEDREKKLEMCQSQVTRDASLVFSRSSSLGRPFTAILLIWPVFRGETQKNVSELMNFARL
jgi:hypothetical protein